MPAPRYDPKALKASDGARPAYPGDGREKYRRWNRRTARIRAEIDRNRPATRGRRPGCWR